MINRKFLTKLLDDNFRRSIILKNHRYVSSEKMKLKPYATYVVDKYTNDRDKDFIDLKEANYGYSPLEVLAYVSKDGNVKKSLFEFNIVAHFLKKNEHKKAVEVVICILAELVNENKKDVEVFDIDRIEAELKKCEEEYTKMQEEMNKLKEENEIHANEDAQET